MFVPIVVAMLVMMLAGIALSEATGAQRMQSAMSVHTARAYWIAEAGLWHAAHDDAEITTPVSFGGGSYTVSGSTGAFRSVGELQGATRVVDYELSGGNVTNSPLDEAASSSTATRVNGRIAALNLVSVSTSDVEIERFQLDADIPGDLLWRLNLDVPQIYRDNTYPPVPTGTLDLNDGTPAERTVSAGDSPELRVRFRVSPVGTVAYELTLFFTNGQSSVVPFTIAW